LALCRGDEPYALHEAFWKVKELRVDCGCWSLRNFMRQTSGFLIGAGLALMCLNYCGYPAAILCREGIDLNGNALKADSYDSSDPTKSFNGRYDPLKAGDFGDVACSGGITNGLPIGEALIYGHLFIDSNSPVVLGTNGGVGTHAWLTTNTGIEPGYEMNGVNSLFPDTTAPYSSGLTPGQGDIVTGAVTNHYDHVIYDGDYSAADLSGVSIALGTARLVLPSGLLMSGIDSITVAPGASLVIYSGGSICAINGTSIVNQGGSARSFVVFCSSAVTNFTLNAIGACVGMFFAPNAAAYCNGSGNSVADISGVLIARSLTLNGNFNFHFDQSLTAVRLHNPTGPPFQFQVLGTPGFAYVVQATANLTSWVTLITNSSPFTFVDTKGSALGERFYRAVYFP
jgi:hypothetical protein